MMDAAKSTVLGWLFDILCNMQPTLMDTAVVEMMPNGEFGLAPVTTVLVFCVCNCALKMLTILWH